MDNLAATVAATLAARSSRRHFMKLLSAGSMGTALALTRSGVTLADASGPCYGCGGGNCSSCSSPAPPCTNCATCGGCGSGCTTTGYWFACDSSHCQVICAECCCGNSGCHCFNRTGSKCAGGVFCPC